MEKYTVLMCVYKNDKSEYLDISIKSMINQTIAPNEMIIVLDGEVPSSIEKLLATYQKNYNFIHVYKIENNVGLGKALDYGLNYCNNNLVARMDADDISLPSRCEKLIKLFQENPNLAIAGTNVDEFVEDTNKIISTRVVPSSYQDILKFSRRRSPFNHPTVMFKKDEVTRCGGYGVLRRKQDFDLFSRMIHSGCYALNINESLLLFRANEDNFLRRRSKEYYKSTIEVIKLNHKRGYCSWGDVQYVKIGQFVIRYSPKWLAKFLSNKLLRKRK